MKKILALGLLAVSATVLLTSCSSSTTENLNSRPKSKSGPYIHSKTGDCVGGKWVDLGGGDRTCR